MPYIYDFIFIIIFLCLKQLLKCIHDSQYSIFMSMRENAILLEVSFVLLAMYYAPHHSRSEKAVCFFICLLTARLYSSFVKRFIKCKHFSHNNHN